MKRNQLLIGGALIAAGSLLVLNSCRTIPEGLEAVHNFEKTRYLGSWYEVARLDYFYEKGLSNVTANYSLKPNGMIEVINKGYDEKKGKWKQSIGKAKFAGSDETGMLKVSFFGPFYAGYNVLAIDSDYQYALVAGSKKDYLWLLSRTPEMPESTKEQYLQLAREKGFAVDQLVWVAHDQAK